MSYTLEFLDAPQAFLVAAREYLAARPVSSTVVAVTTSRTTVDDRNGVPRAGGYPWWWLVVRDDSGAVVGAGMRTATFPPYAPYVLAMPNEAARQLARVLHERGERIEGINGAVPAAPSCAEELARLTERRTRVVLPLRLFELDELVPPVAMPAGRLRRATEDDVELALAWYEAFARDADEQAGRREVIPGPVETTDSMLRRLRRGDVRLWEDGDGAPVHLTASSAPSFGVSRLGPVYTPDEHRGRGYASAAVAEVSRSLREAGARVCLFADQANPTSNRIYIALGYRFVEDQTYLVLE